VTTASFKEDRRGGGAEFRGGLKDGRCRLPIAGEAADLTFNPGSVALAHHGAPLAAVQEVLAAGEERQGALRSRS